MAVARSARPGFSNRWNCSSRLEELEADVSEDELAAEMAARSSTVRAFERRRPSRKPFSESHDKVDHRVCYRYRGDSSPSRQRGSGVYLKLSWGAHPDSPCVDQCNFFVSQYVVIFELSMINKQRDDVRFL